MQSFTEVEDIYCIVKNVFDYHSIGKHGIVKVRERERSILGEKKAFVMLECLCEGAFACRCLSVLYEPDDHHKLNDG